MAPQWCEAKKKFLEGLKVINNRLSDDIFKEKLMEIHEFHKASNDLSELLNIQPITSDELTQNEWILILKTIYYLVERLSIFILSPVKLQNDLSDLGLKSEKSEVLVKWYSANSRNIVSSLDSNEAISDINIGYSVKTSLSNEANQKCKTPLATVSIQKANQEIVLNDLSHSELSEIFDQMENIQRELDALRK